MLRLTVGEVARVKGAQHSRVSSRAAGSETPACSHPCESETDTGQEARPGCRCHQTATQKLPLVRCHPKGSITSQRVIPSWGPHVQTRELWASFSIKS